MQKAISRILLASASLAATLAPTPGLAADGIELIGFGARQKAVAGADVADSVDAMSMSINPAGIVGMDRQYQFGITALLPDRGYEASGPLVVLAPGDVQSGRPIFPGAQQRQCLAHRRGVRLGHGLLRQWRDQHRI